MQVDGSLWQNMLARNSASVDCEDAHTESYDAAAWGKVAHSTGPDLFAASSLPTVWPAQVHIAIAKHSGFASLPHGLYPSSTTAPGKSMDTQVHRCLLLPPCLHLQHDLLRKPQQGLTAQETAAEADVAGPVPAEMAAQPELDMQPDTAAPLHASAMQARMAKARCAIESVFKVLLRKSCEHLYTCHTQGFPSRYCIPIQQCQHIACGACQEVVLLLLLCCIELSCGSVYAY